MDLREMSGVKPADDSSRRHPWERSRFRFFRDVLFDTVPMDQIASILDAGAGDAWFSRSLIATCQAHRIVCWDTEYEPGSRDHLGIDDARVELATRRPKEQFELILALDVLEHVPNDRGFLTEMVTRNLAPGGYALISVPAWQVLFSRHDEFLGHYRRYTPRQLHSVIKAAGLAIERHGGLFHSLLVPRAAAVLGEHLLHRWREHNTGPRTLQWDHGRWVTGLVDGALRVDNLVSRVAARASVSLPGLSAWALCRR